MARQHIEPVYQFCCAFYEAERCPPTIQQIVAHFGFTAYQVERSLWFLRAQGRIHKRVPVKYLDGSA